MNLFENIKPPSDFNWYRHVTLLAASSASATLVTHPVDIIRVQMQSQFAYISPRQVLKKIFRYRGHFGIYYGLVTTIQREFSYCWLRFALYENARSRGMVEGFSRKLQVASASGFLGGVISTPLNKVALRIRTDAAKAPGLRYNYAHVFHGLRELYKEGGFSNYFNMVKISALRSTVMTALQLTTYHQVKESLENKDIDFNHDWQVYLLSSGIAGTVTIIFITPIDVVEQIGYTQHAKTFCGEWHIIRHIKYLHGLKGFYRGLLPNIIRIPTQTILTFLIYENIISNIPKLP